MIGRYAQNEKTCRCAFSLIEVVASTLLVGLLLAASLQTVATVGTVRQRTRLSNSGPTLAHSLLAEVLNHPYTDPDVDTSVIGIDQSESASNRATFDDVDDFHGWFRNSAEHSDGSAIPGGTGWQRQVSVQYVDPATLAAQSTDTGLKQITVAVTSPQGELVTAQALRSSLGATQRTPHADRTLLTGVSVEVVAGSSQTPVQGRVTLRNHVRGD